MDIKQRDLIHSVLAGIVGMLFLVSVYWLILYITTRDLSHPFQQFLLYKYWISALILGFGIQVSLFWYIRIAQGSSDMKTKSSVAVGTGTSTLSMVACCAHHLVDFLPLLGLSAASLFLSKYQTYFFGLGIISNIFGIIMMIRIIKKINNYK
jgi:hypothetical protein